MPVPRREQETVVCFNRHENFCIVTSTDPSIQKRLAKRFGSPELLSPSVHRWSLPAKAAKLPNLSRRSVVLTEKQTEARKQAMRLARASKAKNPVAPSENP